MSDSDPDRERELDKRIQEAQVRWSSGNAGTTPDRDSNQERAEIQDSSNSKRLDAVNQNQQKIDDCQFWVTVWNVLLPISILSTIFGVINGMGFLILLGMIVSIWVIPDFRSTMKTKLDRLNYELHCTKCRSLATADSIVGEHSYSTTTTETRRVTHYNSEGQETGYSESDYEVPTTESEYKHKWECLECGYSFMYTGRRQ